MDRVRQEIRQAARRLRRSPAFTLASLLTLALTIGANVALFAVVHRVVLNPLPYPGSDHLIELDHGAHRLKLGTGFGITAGLYLHYVDRARSLDSAAVYRTFDATATGDGEPERIRVARSTPSLVSVLRVPPAVGRWFTEQEGVPGSAPVAVLSHRLWMRRFKGDPAVLGRPIVLNNNAVQVVGVMPVSFGFPDSRVDVWVAAPIARANGFGLWEYKGIARLRDGATLETARTELNQLIADVPRAYPGDPLAMGNVQSNVFFSGMALKDATLGGSGRALWVLLASSCLVLLVACANVANLFLVRSDARQREVAVRRALGAGRFRLLWFFLTESALLSLAGGAVGLVLAEYGVDMLVRFGPANLPRLGEVKLDGVAVAMAFAVSLVAAVTFAAIPLWRTRELAASLNEEGRSNTVSRGHHRARHVLMGAQIAMALVLLVASGLMVRSFQKLRALDPGFDPSSTLTFSIGLPDREYPTREAAVAAHQAILDKLAALPGVRAASGSTCLPLAGGCDGNTLRIEGRVLPPGTIPPVAVFRAVAAGYFQAIGMRLVRGRSIDRADVDHREPVVVIDETLAKTYFPNQDPVGQRVASNRPGARPGEAPLLTWLTVVGIVANTPVRTLGETNPLPQLFMPMSIASGPGVAKSALAGPDVSVMSFVVRAATRPLDLTQPVRQAIAEVDRNVAVAQVRTLQETVDRASGQMAFTMVLLVIAASVALLLGVIGVYGVMAYIVSQRTVEIGVRLALGADPTRIAGDIVRQGGLVALSGVGVGVAVALVGTRLLASLLYGVGPRDPIIFAAATVILQAVALVACWFPARRAARLNPLEALR